jgi:hypothetical protein
MEICRRIRMRPPACVSCKWGTGTTCEKQTNTASHKELEEKLKQIQMARSQMDAAWFAPPVVVVEKPPTTSSEPTNTKRK